MLKKFLVAAIFVAVILVLVFVSQGKKTEEDILRIGYLPLADHLPLMVAAGEDLFEGVSVELVRFSDWPSLVESLRSGGIDGAHIINTLAVKMAYDGFDGQVVALSHRGHIELSAGNHIHSVNDLREGDIAVPTRFSPHYMMLHNFLTQEGIEMDIDVGILDVAPPDFVSTVASGGTDAFIGSQPFPAMAENLGVSRTIKHWHDMQIEGTNGLDCVIFFPTDFIDKNEDLIQNYVNSIIYTGEFIQENPQRSAEAASEFMLNIDPEIILEAMQAGTYSELMLIESEFTAFQDYMIELGLISAPIDLEKFLNKDFAQNAYKQIKETN